MSDALPQQRANVSEEMVERAAIALWNDNELRWQRAQKEHYGREEKLIPWDSAHDFDHDEFRDKARVALEAAL